MNSITQDLRFAVRVLARNRTFTAIALLTLCLCIGANTAIFTVLNSVLLTPLPYPEPDRLVLMYNCYPGVGVDRGASAMPDYADRRPEKDIFEEVALMRSRSMNVGSDGSPERVEGLGVTPSFFPLLKIQPTLGRVFTEEEGTPGNEKVVVLSYGLWQQMFAGDPGVLGQDVRLSGVQHSIVGVMPQGFEAETPSPGLEQNYRLWVPLAFSAEDLSDQRRHNNSWEMVARLQPGVSVEQARAKVDAINRSIADRIPEMAKVLETAGFYTNVAYLHDEMVEDVRLNLYLLQAAVAFVLLIGAVNIANLLVVRANVRQRELSLRCALGAGRWRLARQLLTESVLLAIGGGAAGVVVGVLGVRALSALAADNIPRGAQIQVDADTLWFTLGLSIVTGIFFGAVPLIHALAGNLAGALRQTGRGGTSGRSSVMTRNVLVVAQVTLAFVLLIGAGLMVVSMSRVLGVEPGFNPERVLSAFISLPGSRYGDDTARIGFASRALESARALPGVAGVGLTDYLPFSGSGNTSVITAGGYEPAPGEPPPVPGWADVDKGYFDVMGIPLLQGRIFREGDTAGARRVVVIDEFLAERYWPGEDPIGKRIRRGMDVGRDEEENEEDQWVSVVGVVGSVHLNDLADDSQVGMVYFHYRQYPPGTFAMVLKAAGDEKQLVSPLRAAILDLDSEQPIYGVLSQDERMQRSLAKRRGTVWLASIFAGLALFLAAIGIYGVLSYSVTQRTPEIGVRMALGANSTEVLWMVARQGLTLATIGLVAGLLAAFLVTRLIESLLYDVSAQDPLTFVGAALALGIVAIIAAVIPSLRATRIQPMNALRYE
jgi:putative ABC transport system permease protein